MKPCFICKQPAPVTFDAKCVFDLWATQNGIIAPCRSRFDNVREALRWAALDESDEGAHPECALHWAVSETGWDCRYPLCDLNELTESPAPVIPLHVEQ